MLYKNGPSMDDDRCVVHDEAQTIERRLRKHKKKAQFIVQQGATTEAIICCVFNRKENIEKQVICYSYTCCRQGVSYDDNIYVTR